MVAFATIAAVSTVVFSWQLSHVITQVFIEGRSISTLLNNLIFAGAAAIMRAAVIIAQEVAAQKASASVKFELREKFNFAIKKLGVGWLAEQSAARLNLLSTSGLDALDAYFAKYVPQLIYTALITPVFVVLIWSVDAASGWVLVATIPLIPVFMILIGWATQKAQGQQLSALTRLSQHFLEALRGLTTLRVFNRAETQVEILRKASEEHRVRTMRVLRISFLSGFALELLASLSVALIAVSIGLRLVSGEISLPAGMFILLLAPEAFLPLRMVGAQFHAASEGVAASTQVLQVIDQAQAAKFTKPETNRGLVQSGKLNVLIGASGSGKTTLMNSLIDLSAPSEIDRIAWMPQSPSLLAASVRENIIGPAGLIEVDTSALSESLEMAALDDLDLDLDVGEAGSRISGGQSQRIALARCFYRALSLKCELILLDEPISSIDSRRAAVVSRSLRDLANRGFAVLAISHQDRLEKIADRVIVVNHV